MGLNFLVLEGPRKGDQFRILAGLSLGRSRGDIPLRDAKISNSHAKIEQELSGDLVLVDTGSSNGIWLENQQVERLTLKTGLVFTVGDTVLKVLDDHELELSDEERNTWRGRLWTYLKSLTTQPGKALDGAGPFKKTVELSFVTGPQAGTTWQLGFGPRVVGSASPDLVLHEPEAPDQCFALEPKDADIVFKTHHSSHVLLNGMSRTSEKLKSGDEIKIGETVLRVTLLD